MTIIENAVRQTIELKLGIKAEELVFSHCNEGESRHRLVWCRFPFEEAIVGGLPNVLFKVDFPVPNGAQTVAAAREEARKAFIEYYHLEKY